MQQRYGSYNEVIHSYLRPDSSFRPVHNPEVFSIVNKTLVSIKDQFCANATFHFLFISLDLHHRVLLLDIATVTRKWEDSFNNFVHVVLFVQVSIKTF